MLISLIEASRRFSVSYWKLSRMVMRDLLPAVSVDGFLMVSEEDVRACVSHLEHGGRCPPPARRAQERVDGNRDSGGSRES